MRRQLNPRAVTAVLALVGVLLAVGVVPVGAHHTSLRVPLVSSGGPVPINLAGPGQFELLSSRGGQIQFKLSGAKDSVSGLPASASDNVLRASLVINGVPEEKAILFDIVKGRVALVRQSLGLQANDAVEVRGVTLETSGGTVFGTIGVRASGPTLSSALVNVVTSPSPLLLSNSRDADVVLTGRAGGKLTVRFDKITPADAPNNRAELEYSVNGGAPNVLFSDVFDIVDDFGKLIAPVNQPLGAGDVLQILRLEVVDQNGDPFAALGVRITGP